MERSFLNQCILETEKNICYNADRQNDASVQDDTKNPGGGTLWGFSIPTFGNGKA